MTNKKIQAPLIVLAGGFGTRLSSVLKGLPKPLADINGIPFIEYLFQNWIQHGFSDFILSLHYEADKIIDFVERKRDTLFKDCRVRCVTEPQPMGTGGAIAYLLGKEELGDCFFIANADTWVENGYEVLNETEGNVIGVVQIADTSRYGSVELSPDNFIERFVEKNDLHESGYINAGIYKLSTSLFQDWDGMAFSLEQDFFPKLIEKKLLKGKTMVTGFIDIGIPEDYYSFCHSKKQS